MSAADTRQSNVCIINPLNKAWKDGLWPDNVTCWLHNNILISNISGKALTIFSRGKWNLSTGQSCLASCGTDWYSALLISFTTQHPTAFDIIILHIEQVRTNLLSHNGDESPAPQQESEYFFYCKLPGHQSSYVTHSWLTNSLFISHGEHSSYTDLSGLHKCQNWKTTVYP